MNRFYRVVAVATTGLVLGAGLFFLGSNAGSGRPQALSEAQMETLVGGDGCFNCRYAGTRIDECYHQGYVDTCLTNKCLANYALEDTCDLGTGTCSAAQFTDQPWLAQYVRADSGCATNNPRTWVVWFTHYYGAGCATNAPKVRCQKASGSCDGSLIDSVTRYPGIKCTQ